ncbi:MAG: FHA domain-containing protein [Candidatus Abyssobacteria bacterium SURF_17]|jgi:pSer/pThr/pTyr-binding forkhead associated (FHA) protein|uniref:FHA domain-containing protein n=1 Tax=Candidatus Abyssobacteria bacterium SURF_17 TaxID=2093361 RepID=A0A419EWQ4_9BACT|nr:MAG: FHA domain-containing protein [Candidatus Abyssubacteria bacterium SURF_17]
MKVIVVKGAGAGTEFRLHDGINMLGRDVTNRIRVLDPRVSRKHCKIKKICRSLFLSDLGTKNGTAVNGNTVSEIELVIGDEIRIGSTTLRVVDEDYESADTAYPSKGVSFFKQITMAIFGNRERAKAGVIEEEFPKFSRKPRKRLWRPTVDTDPHEGRRQTIPPHSNPD